MNNAKFFVYALLTRFGLMVGIIGFGYAVFKSALEKDWVKQTVTQSQSQALRK